MNNIRGRHISPGIYTNLKNVSRIKPKDKYNNQGVLKSDNKNNGGKNPPEPVIKYWVFGDTFPAVFS